MSTIHSRIKQARESAGLTQAQLAEKIRSGRVSISRWETGAAIPSQHALASIGYITGFSPDWLRDGEGDPHKARFIANFESLVADKSAPYRTDSPINTELLTQALDLVLQELLRRKATLPPSKIAAAVVEIYNLMVTQGKTEVAAENVTPFVNLLLAR